ncbi:GSCFA domain-containing protein [Pelagicoccus albus]|uniref:GSCFA domain-containing protein n=1 Tax=Pelagicoccus albus TaxID=415222 RepID=A0A7X1B4Y3_9BACT|nr:GSCFA domain-containing protein [Pelagicoccus albus]MBC2605723.1 GSCFA domain-containing protein [Pelagicoccus albus]
MRLQTKVEIPYSHLKYSHDDVFVSLGSCFAEELGSRLEARLFDCVSNPFGTLYNPVAISELATRALDKQTFAEDEFFQHQELWRHFIIHSSLASTSLSESISRANDALVLLRESLLNCDLLCLTLGSAWIYQTEGADTIVAHNHRLPLEKFTRRILKTQEIVDSISNLTERLPRAKVCLTVSPVRHLRDGLIENNRSKSTLILACHELENSSIQIDYFPSYEILLDELRDYRFYSSDLTHPNQIATDYIWERFCDTYLSPLASKLCREIESILTALHHRPHHTDTTSYAAFKAGLQKRIQSIADSGICIAPLEEIFSKLP